MKKLLKYFLYLILTLGAIFALVYFGSSPLLKKLVSQKLENERIAGVYQVSFENAYFNLFRMGVSITGVELKPDSSVEIQKLFPYQKQLVYLKIARLNIFDIDPIKYLQEEKIDVHSISIKDPLLHIYINKSYKKPKASLIEDSPFEIDLEELHLQEIIVSNMEFHFYNKFRKKADISVKEIDLKITKPKIDFNKIDDIWTAMDAKNIELELRKIRFYDAKSFYKTTLKSAKYHFKKNTITLKDLDYKPVYKKAKFAKKSKYQTDRMDISLAKIEIEGFDFLRFIEKKVIGISKVKLHGLKMEVYRDKNYPVNLSRFPKLPQQALRNLKQKLEIKEIKLKSSTVVYIEKAEGEEKAGKVEFKEVKASIKDFGNTWLYKEKKTMEVDAELNVYGKAKVKIELDFPLKYNTFYLKGEVGKAKMNIFNPISISNAGVKIRDGKIDKITFSANLNDTRSSGKMKLLYHDLDISILQKVEGSGLRKESKLLNFMANSFIIPEQNPNKRGKEYKATIEFTRNKNKGLLAYIWKSIFSGIKDTIQKKNKKRDKKKKK